MRTAARDETKFNGWIQKGVAERIIAAAGQDFASLSAAAKVKGFKPVPLGVKARLSFANDVREISTSNVIGLLPGKTRPDEYVLYTAHYDHLGRCPPVDGNEICNGAVDNATGTAALVALADGFRQAGAPERSVLFIALGAEESGLLGSEYYAANPVYPLSQTVGGVNMDALYPQPPARDVKVIGGGKSELDARAAECRRRRGPLYDPRFVAREGLLLPFGPFQHGQARRADVLCRGGRGSRTGGLAAGKAWAEEYTARRYHAPSDEYSESWDWSGMMRELRLFYRIGRELADSEDWPNWYQGDEFRAARDASCAEKTAEGGC